MLKQFKIITLAPTCFGSRWNHHQGADMCLAKTTKYGFSVLVQYRRSQCYGGISACCAGVRFTVETANDARCKHENPHAIFSIILLLNISGGQNIQFYASYNYSLGSSINDVTLWGGGDVCDNM